MRTGRENLKELVAIEMGKGISRGFARAEGWLTSSIDHYAEGSFVGFILGMHLIDVLSETAFKVLEGVLDDLVDELEMFCLEREKENGKEYVYYHEAMRIARDLAGAVREEFMSQCQKLNEIEDLIYYDWTFANMGLETTEKAIRHFVCRELDTILYMKVYTEFTDAVNRVIRRLEGGH